MRNSLKLWAEQVSLPLKNEFAPSSSGSRSRSDDEGFMQAALTLARRGLGNVWPNPAVGCVIVRDGAVVGRGWTQPGGRPHAEPQALAQAGSKAEGATVYVTLEPCSHYGKTPPCADALRKARIARCVCAMTDSDPRVSGRGVRMLQEAGISVEVGLCGEQARHLNAGFFSRIEQGRPLVLLKTATSLDGRIALANGDSKWITGAQARAYGHQLRASHDAILVGLGTVLADDPDLTCRLPGGAVRQPVRVVLDSQLRVPSTARLIASASPQVPSWVVTTASPSSDRVRAFAQRDGLQLIHVDGDAEGRPAPQAVLAALAERGITRLMIEGGGQVAASFIRAELVDRIAWFRAAKVLGSDAMSGVGGLALDQLASCPVFSRYGLFPLGADQLELYERH